MNNDMRPMTPKEAEEAILVCLEKLEHEPSKWNGMMVYEAGDVDDVALTIRNSLRALLLHVGEEMPKEDGGRALNADYNNGYAGGVIDCKCVVGKIVSEI